MRKLRMWMLALKIEQNWKQIAKNRRRMENLLSKREPYTSPQLVELDRDTARLGYEARRLEARYRSLAG